MPEMQESLLEHAAPTPRADKSPQDLDHVSTPIRLGENQDSNDPLGIRPLIVQHFIENGIELLPGFEMDALVRVGGGGKPSKLLWIEDRPHPRQP